MAIFGSSMGYSDSHGEKLRKERRDFARETSERKRLFESKEAKIRDVSRMSEIERRQTGETGRATMREAGETGRTKLREAGEFKRTGMRIAGERDRTIMGLSGKASRGGFTGSQMASLRKGALGQAQKKWDKIWEDDDVDPLTGKAMTQQQKNQIIGLESQSILDYSLAGQEGEGDYGDPYSDTGEGDYGGPYSGTGGETSAPASPEQMEEYRRQSIRDYDRGDGRPVSGRAAARRQAMGWWRPEQGFQPTVGAPPPPPGASVPGTSRKFSTRLQQMSKTPRQGFDEMGEALNYTGLGAEDWKATGRLYGRTAKRGWEGYKGFVNRALSGQEESRRRLPAYR